MDIFFFFTILSFRDETFLVVFFFCKIILVISVVFKKLLTLKLLLVKNVRVSGSQRVDGICLMRGNFGCLFESNL